MYVLLLSLPSIYSKEGKEYEFIMSLLQHLKTLVIMPLSCLLMCFQNYLRSKEKIRFCVYQTIFQLYYKN